MTDLLKVFLAKLIRSMNGNFAFQGSEFSPF